MFNELSINLDDDKITNHVWTYKTRMMDQADSFPERLLGLPREWILSS